LFAATGVCIAQGEQTAPADETSNMSAIDFMVGDWEGEGWVQFGREKKAAKIRESFTRKLGGSLVVVDGLGTRTDPDTGKVEIVHNAFGVFYYDHAAKKIAFRYYKEDGAEGMTFPEFSKNKLVWGFVAEPSKSKVRFTEHLDADGFWIANGEVMPPGMDRWIPFFYMKLSRVK
jgi:hypothetical protein